MILETVTSFSLDDLRRDVRYACLKSPGPGESDTLDPYGFISQPAIVRRLGLWIATRLDANIERLMGVGASALPIALAVGLEISVPVAFIDSDAVRGELSPGDHVAVVADITRTGDSALATIEACQGLGADVTQVFVLWDRAQGAMERLGAMEIPTHILIEDRPRARQPF